MSEADVLLEIEDLRTWFDTDVGVARAVDGVSYRIRRGETVGVVGESGCGKSVTALSLMRLIPRAPGRIVSGSIRFLGADLCTMREADLRKVRGARISMIFQEPMTSLNPVYTIGDQIAEAILVHEDVTEDEARERTIAMLARVGIPSPDTRVDEYPHQLSGGMRQRVMIAMALACGPELLIADEPTTALDVTIQAQILELIRELQAELGMSVLLITHDLGVVAETCDRVVVMYAGKVVEEAPVTALFHEPAHPYTLALFRSLPDQTPKGTRLATIPGMVPAATEFPEGCRFRARCGYADAACEAEPPLTDVAPDHQAACFHLDTVRADPTRRSGEVR